MKRLFVITLSIILLSCSEDKTEYSVDPVLKPYLDTFYQEAAARGMVIKKDNLILQQGAEWNTGIDSQSGQRRVYLRPELILQWDADPNTKPIIETMLFNRLSYVILGKTTDYSKWSLSNPLLQWSAYKVDESHLSQVKFYNWVAPDFGPCPDCRTKLLDELFR